MENVTLSWGTYLNLDSIPFGFVYIIAKGINVVKSDYKDFASQSKIIEDDISFDTIYAAEIADKTKIEGIVRFLNDFLRPSYISIDYAATPVKVNIPVWEIN